LGGMGVVGGGGWVGGGDVRERRGWRVGWGGWVCVGGGGEEGGGGGDTPLTMPLKKEGQTPSKSSKKKSSDRGRKESTKREIILRKCVSEGDHTSI